LGSQNPVAETAGRLISGVPATLPGAMGMWERLAVKALSASDQRSASKLIAES